MDTMTSDAAAVTAVIGYSNVVRQFLPERFKKDMVLVSCLLGILYAFSIRPGKTEIVHNITSGIMVGLMASGGYAGMKNFVENREKKSPTAA